MNGMNGWSWIFLAVALGEGVVIAYLARMAHRFADMALARTSAYLRSIHAAAGPDDAAVHRTFGLQPLSLTLPPRLDPWATDDDDDEWRN